VRCNGAGFIVPGVALVRTIIDVRPARMARQIAQRIAADETYLAAAVELGIEGIDDLRPRVHHNGERAATTVA
jgi:hypothetical protein